MTGRDSLRRTATTLAAHPALARRPPVRLGVTVSQQELYEALSSAQRRSWVHHAPSVPDAQMSFGV